VVDEVDADEGGGVVHAVGEELVVWGRRRIAARLGAEEDDAGGAADEALPEDLARFDGGAVEVPRKISWWPRRRWRRSRKSAPMTCWSRRW
jgi:hypothetical protein